MSSSSVDPTAIERYIEERFAQEDGRLVEIRRVSEAEGLPDIQLHAVTARTVQLLLRLIGARRVLEVGTLAGYSALWIARALPRDVRKQGGRLVTIEVDPERAALARKLLDRAGVGDLVEVHEGDAHELLPALVPDAAFDAVLLDADKEGIPAYLEEARRLLRPGGLLLIDNALWRGRVVDEADEEASTRAIRKSHELIAHDPAFDASILPVGDGLLVGIRL